MINLLCKQLIIGWSSRTEIRSTETNCILLQFLGQLDRWIYRRRKPRCYYRRLYQHIQGYLSCSDYATHRVYPVAMSRDSGFSNKILGVSNKSAGGCDSSDDCYWVECKSIRRWYFYFRMMLVCSLSIRYWVDLVFVTMCAFLTLKWGRRVCPDWLTFYHPAKST